MKIELWNASKYHYLKSHRLIKSSKDLKIACVLIENILISSRVIFLVHWDVE